MKRRTRMNRRTFLTAAGTLVAGAGSASPAAGLPTVRTRVSLPHEPEVLVVGGDPAACIGAALGAARTGANTLLIESCGFLGGVAEIQDAWRKDGVDLTLGGRVQKDISGDRGV